MTNRQATGHLLRSCLPQGPRLGGRFDPAHEAVQLGGGSCRHSCRLATRCGGAVGVAHPRVRGRVRLRMCSSSISQPVSSALIATACS